MGMELYMFVGVKALLGGTFDGEGHGETKAGAALGERWFLVDPGSVCQVHGVVCGTLCVSLCCCGV